MLRSDDPHVLAVALVSGARVLFSFDAALCDDFRDRRIIKDPRGKILRSEPHVRRLRAGSFIAIAILLVALYHEYAV
jgi:hypothetical protein